jgi:uncharacterized protein (TIGR03083 family)
MVLPREEVVAGLNAELATFEALVRSLDDAAWAAPSRCGTWSAADVAAHVIGQFADVTAGRFDGLGTPEVTARQVDERRGRSPLDLADELREAAAVGATILGSIDETAWTGAGPTGGTLGSGVEALWYDAYLHADDIRAAAALDRIETDAGNRASLSHLAEILTAQGWGPATLALDGHDEFPVAGGGRRVTGPPFLFVLVATGREDPAALGLDETVNVYR